MAEARKARFDQIFPCTPKRSDVCNAVGKARWKERCEKINGSVISYAKKFKKIFHTKPISQTKASASAAKETKLPSCIRESNNLSKSSLKKPPFIVPGRIIYNDLHLIQSIPPIKNPPAKKTVTRTGVVKMASNQYGTSNQALGKIRSATNTIKPLESKTDACPQCKGFIPPTGLTIPEQSIPSLAREVDDLQASSSRYLSGVSTANPWTTVDRRTSAQKPFSGLLNSQESSTSQEDGPELNYSEDSDGESKPLDNKHRNFPYLTRKFLESDLESCVATKQKQPYEIVTIAEVHQNKSEFEFSEFREFRVQITESYSKNDFEESLHVAEKSIEVAQQLQEQEVCQNNEGINKNESDVEKSANQIAPPSKTKAEEDTLQQNLHAENMEIAQQLRAQIKEKKTQLDELCRLWNNRLNEGNSIPNDEIGAVLTVIGQTQQLQRERFHQYAGLILEFENKSDEKKIAKTDLEGFWEMILLQVTDVENKFTELDSLHKKGWTRQENFEFQLKKTRKPKKKNVDKVYIKSSGIRSHIASLRKKQMESSSLLSGDCVSYADQPSLLNPSKEDAFISPLIDKRGPIIQQEIELTTNEKCSTPKETRETPNYIRVQRGSRKKHKSASSITFFSSPHQTDSPRQRSHSTNFMLDQPLVPKSSAEKIMPSNQLLEIPKMFSPTVNQFITRTGRISRSPDRFGHTEEQRNSSCTEIHSSLSPMVKLFVTRTGRVSRSPDRFGQTEECKTPLNTPQSHLSQFTQPQQQNVERSSLSSDHMGITTNIEENNNDLKDSVPAVTLPNFA